MYSLPMNRAGLRSGRVESGGRHFMIVLVNLDDTKISETSIKYDLDI